MSRCPSAEQLRELVEERLAEADFQAISEHVGSCALCQAALDRLTEDTEIAGKLQFLARRPAETPTPLPSLKGMEELRSVAPAPSLPHSTPDEQRTTPPRTPTQPGGPAERAETPAEMRVAGYEILGEIGRGGMGVVYKARHAALNRIVALKMILAGGHAGAEQVARFRIEAEAVARLQHPNIVQIFEVGETQGRPFCALEFVEGNSLAQHLAGKPQPARASAALVETLARAMYAAHQKGIVHRDLKPANVLLVAPHPPSPLPH